MARGTVYNRVFNKEDWNLVNIENKDIMEDFLEEYKQKKIKESTLKQYHNDLRIVMIYILKELKNKCILELNKKDFRRFNLWLQDKGMSSSRVNRLMSSTRSMLTYIEEDDDYDYDSNIAKKIKGLPKQAVRTNEDNFFLSYKQVMDVRAKLIEMGKLQWAVLWMLFYDSGARRTEVFQATKVGILEGNKTNIVIGKRGKTFPLVFLNDTKELIKQYLEERGEDDIDSLWIKGTGKNKVAITDSTALYTRMVSISEILSVMDDKEIELFCHSMRHTRCEHLLQGMDERLIDKATGEPRKFTLEEVQVFLHHSDPKTTQGYAKDHSDDVIDNMFDIM